MSEPAGSRLCSCVSITCTCSAPKKGKTHPKPIYGIAIHNVNSIIASTLTRRLNTRRSTVSHQRSTIAHPPAHVGQQYVTADLADEHRQNAVDEGDKQKQPLELALPDTAPLHSDG